MFLSGGSQFIRVSQNSNPPILPQFLTSEVVSHPSKQQSKRILIGTKADIREKIHPTGLTLVPQSPRKRQQNNSPASLLPKVQNFLAITIVTQTQQDILRLIFSFLPSLWNVNRV